MRSTRALESRLDRLLTFGTILCTATIAIGVAIDMFDAQLSTIDFVSVGTVGFICLPVLRIMTMLKHHVASKDIAMAQVVAVVLAMVAVGLLIGIFI